MVIVRGLANLIHLPLKVFERAVRIGEKETPF